MFWIILAIIIIWCIVWLAQHFLKRLCHFFDHYVKKLWDYLNNHHNLQWIPKFISDPQYIDNHKQLNLLLAALICFAVFIFILIGVKNQNFITAFNLPFYHLLQSLRINACDKIMLALTFLGETKALIIAQIIFILYLAWKRHWYTMFHAVAIVLLYTGGVWGTKMLVHIPRPNGFPNGILTFYKDFSFPSGHTAGCIIIYGFLSVIIARQLKHKLRWIPYSAAALITTLVIISRLYLGAHWLTDILGAIFLGLALLFFVTTSYCRHHHLKISAAKTSITAAIIFSCTMSLYAIHNFQFQLIHYYWPYSQTKIMELKNWKNQTDNQPLAMIPLYRTDRFGHPINAFNVQWVGDISVIKHHLLNQGWQNYPARFNLQEILFRVTNLHNNIERVPILTQLYNNHPETLLMTKKMPDNKTVILLRLWDANIAFNNSPYSIWIGVVDYYQPPEKLLNNFKKDKQRQKKFTGAVDKLEPYLHTFHWRKIKLVPEAQPEEMRPLNWNGELLLIEPGLSSETS